MRELSQEMTKRMEAASRDTAWTEQLRSAATWEEYEKLLKEKGIEAPAELKEAFSASLANRTGNLADDELEKVSGGWPNLLPCHQQYEFFLCQFSGCPHLTRDEYKPDDKHYTYICKLHNWQEEFEYT